MKCIKRDIEFENLFSKNIAHYDYFNIVDIMTAPVVCSHYCHRFYKCYKSGIKSYRKPLFYMFANDSTSYMDCCRENNGERFDLRGII